MGETVLQNRMKVVLLLTFWVGGWHRVMVESQCRLARWLRPSPSGTGAINRYLWEVRTSSTTHKVSRSARWSSSCSLECETTWCCKDALDPRGTTGLHHCPCTGLTAVLASPRPPLPCQPVCTAVPLPCTRSSRWV